MRIDSSQLNPRATGSKSRTWAAILVLNIETSNSVTRLTAETPLIMFFQHASFPTPLGEIMPTPVTTTRLAIYLNPFFMQLECFLNFIYRKISFALLDLMQH